MRRQVVCEVMAVHWDRLDVKVAVKYPKSYGPRNGREERLAAMKAEKVRVHTRYFYTIRAFQNVTAIRDTSFTSTWYVPYQYKLKYEVDI